MQNKIVIIIKSNKNENVKEKYTYTDRMLRVKKIVYFIHHYKLTISQRKNR